MSDIVDRLRDPINQDIPFTELMLDAAARIEQLEADQRDTTEEFRLLSHDFGKALLMIEQLEAALREIATYEIEDGCPCSACQHSALARAALAAPSGAMDVHSIDHKDGL